MDFTNKVVLVTGAGAGIGRATSLLFAKNGAKVAVNALMPNEKQSGLITVDLIRENGGEAVFIPGDISKSNTAEMIIKDTIKAFGKIDILINNAGDNPRIINQDINFPKSFYCILYYHFCRIRLGNISWNKYGLSTIFSDQIYGNQSTLLFIRHERIYCYFCAFFAKSSEAARPIPAPAPVTKTTLFVKSISIFSFHYRYSSYSKFS